jgi:hypothetical protein
VPCKSFVPDSSAVFTIATMPLEVKVALRIEPMATGFWFIHFARSQLRPSDEYQIFASGTAEVVGEPALELQAVSNTAATSRAAP